MTTTTPTPQVYPTIHLNGTSRSALYKANEKARRSLDDAIRDLVETGPNARDYYPQGAAAFDAAVAQHRSRLERLRAVRNELEAEAEAILGLD